MIPISLVSAVISQADEKTKKVAVIAGALAVAVLTFGIYRMVRILFKPAKSFRADSNSDASYQPSDFNNEKVVHRNYRAIQAKWEKRPVYATPIAPNINPPTKSGWLPAAESDPMEQEFYATL
jgi:hypothetical protein